MKSFINEEWSPFWGLSNAGHFSLFFKKRTETATEGQKRRKLEETNSVSFAASPLEQCFSAQDDVTSWAGGTLPFLEYALSPSWRPLVFNIKHEAELSTWPLRLAFFVIVPPLLLFPVLAAVQTAKHLFNFHLTSHTNRCSESDCSFISWQDYFFPSVSDCRETFAARQPLLSV